MHREGLDDAETIKVRLKEYVERTEPALEYLREMHYIKEINGDRSVAEVFRDINDLN